VNYICNAQCTNNFYFSLQLSDDIKILYYMMLGENMSCIVWCIFLISDIVEDFELCRPAVCLVVCYCNRGKHIPKSTILNPIHVH